MDLVLIRHPAVAVPPGQCYGRSDVPLRDTAAAGATAIAAKLERLGIASYALHSSPLQRCATVARALAGGERMADPDPRLAELDFGAWEGRRWDDVPRAALDAWAADVEHAAPHGGESVARLAERATDWLADVSSRSPAADRPIVALTHAGVIRVMTARALALPAPACLEWALQMTGVCRLHRAPDAPRWHLALWNG